MLSIGSAVSFIATEKLRSVEKLSAVGALVCAIAMAAAAALNTHKWGTENKKVRFYSYMPYAVS